VGAQPTDTVNAILRFKGVLLKKHLQLGVKKGALTQEEADAKLAKWIEQKETSIAKRREESADAKRKFVAAVDGTAKVKAKPAPEPAPAPVVEEAAEIAEAAAAEVAAEEAAPAVEAAAEEAAPAVEAAAEVVAETSEAAAEEKSEEA
jgi:small subunit ribosomal protein S16